MDATWLTLEDVNKLSGYVSLKFVKVAGVFRFYDLDHGALDHAEMITREEMDQVDGAGTIMIGPATWEMAARDSHSLRKLGVQNHFVTAEIEQELEEALIGRKRKSIWD
jgi:hypothetical protein